MKRHLNGLTRFTAVALAAFGGIAAGAAEGKYPGFKGNVKSVDTRDFRPDVAKSPKNQGF